MKKLYSPVVHFTQNLFSAKSITHLKGLSMAALLLPIMTLLPLAGQGQVEGSISAAGKPIVEMTNVDCTAPVINVVYTTQETDCGARDGSINIQIMDLNASPSTYAINLEHGNKGLTTYSGLMAVGGVLTLSDMATGAYSSISVTRETDDCTSQIYSEAMMIRHGCDEVYEERTGCGTGTISYLNCNYETVSINKAYLTTNTYIYVDNDYLGCIAYVDANCQVQPSETVYCADFYKTEPTPTHGYQYGQVHFNKVTGASNAGISELNAERINWIMCNGSLYGYDKVTINRAIWNFTSGSTYGCNALCSAAISAVPSVQGGIAEQMVFYLPIGNSSVQPFVKFACYEAPPSLPVPPDTYVYDCTDGKTIDVYTSGANCANSPDSEVQDLNSDGNVFQAVIEVVYKNTYPGTSVSVNVDGTDYDLAEVSLVGTSSSVWAYRGLVTGAVNHVYHNSATGYCGNGTGLQSLAVYAFKNVPTGRSVSATFTTQSGYCDEQSFSFPINTDIAPRDIEVIMPISELTTDGRHLVIIATAGGQSASTTILGPTGTCCIAAPSVIVPNVPGWANSITVHVNTESNTDPSSPQNCGQSWVMAGYAIIDVDCVECTDPVVVNDNFSTCENTQLSGNVLTNDSNLSNQTVSVTSNPSHGSVSINNNGSFTYTPTNNYAGSDQFHYTVCNQGLACCVEGVVNITVIGAPDVQVSVDNPSCGNDNGSITFTFPNDPGQTSIEFSKNGGSTYPLNVNDNVGTASFNNLASGVYYLWVRWGNDQCPVSLGSVTLTDELGPDAYITCDSDPFESRVISNSDQTCGPENYGFWSGNLLNNWTSDKYFSVQNATFKEYNNGTAVLHMQAVNNSNPGLVFEIETVFSGRSFSPPAGSPKENTQCVGNLNNGDWYYYQTLHGYLIGSNNLAGGLVEFIGYGAAFQVGTGANLNDAAVFGASGWLDFTILNQPNIGAAFIGPSTGDLNINLTGTTLVGRPGLGDCLTVCAGGSTKLTANNSFGTEPFSYSWSTGATDQTITVTPDQTTTYHVTITDANGCTAETEVTVTVNPSPTVTIDKTDSACGANDGTATATGANGTAPYTYAWSNGLGSGPNKTGLAPGTYTVTVTDSKGCIATGTVTIINLSGPSLTANAVPSTICQGESSQLTASASGGAAPYTYSWDHSLGNGAVKTVTPGNTTTYGVTVTDVNGCTATATVTVTVHPAPTVSVSKTNATCGNNNGTASASATGGTGPYTYAWSNGLGSGPNKTGLAPGTYTVTVTDANGCTDHKNVTIINISGPSLTANAVPSTICQGANSQLSASASGGTGPYTYTWDHSLGNGSNKTVSPSMTTTYGVTVTDANSCTATATVTVNVIELPDVTVTSTNPSCGADNGVITFTFPNDPDQTSIEFSKNGGSTYPLNVNDNVGTASFSNLAAGTYSLYVRWGNNDCPVNLGIVTLVNELGPDVYITCDSDPVENRTASNSDQTCGSQNYGFYSGNLLDNWTTQKHWSIQNATFREYNNGSAVLQMEAVNNSNPNLVFQIETVFSGRVFSAPAGSPKENTQCVGNLDNSDWYYYPTMHGYLIGASDLAGSMVEFVGYGASFQVGTGANLNNAAVFGASGWLDFTILSQPNSGSTLLSSTTGDFNIDLSGNTLVGRPGLGDCLTVCAGGSAILTASNSFGTEPFSYLWSTGATSQTINVTPGQTTTYYVTVTDANSCTGEAEVTVTVNPNPTVTIDKTDASCGDENGTATATGNGGMAPYTYAWSNGLGSGPSKTGLAPGTYSVTVTDSKGCTATGSVTIISLDGPSLSANAVPAVICLGENSVLTASATGGTEPYTYTWDHGLGNGAVKNVSPGTSTTYEVMVTDANGCTATATATVTVNQPPVAGNIPPETICLGECADLTATATGGAPDYVFSWSDGLGTGATKHVCPTATKTYTVTITDVNGCFTTTTVTVTVNDLPDLNINGPAEICANELTSYSVTPIIPGATYTWTFNGPATPGTASGPNASVTYTDQGSYLIELSVTDANGCYNTTNTTILVREPITADAGDDQTVCQGGNAVLDGSNSIGSSFTWTIVSGDPTSIDGSTNSETLNVSPLFNTTYRLTVRDATGLCERSDMVTVIVDVNLNPVADASAPSEPVCAGYSVTLDAGGSTPPPSDPLANLNYLWYNGAPSNGNFIGLGETISVTPSQTTEYYVIVSADGDGTTCADTASVVVTIQNCDFDLALRKTIVGNGPFQQGGSVTFQIEVFNQGDLEATNVQVTDYIPTGLTLSDGAWSQSGNLATRTIAGPIAANGGSATITISFNIDADYEGSSIVNYAEISHAENPLNQPDIDSTPDQDNTNDAGGQPNSPADNAVNGNGSGTPGDGNPTTDEDDHDPALIQLPVITLDKTFVSAVVQPDGSYYVTYTVEVTNNGAVSGDYTLTDSPLFEDDVTITAWDYTFVDVNGGFGNGPAFQDAPPVPINFGTKTLTAGNTHIYTLGFNVTLD
ncbi:MAG: PKD domain-containing protein, partial [Lewinellaceae bacterium]|nr:PKD domain-containing protein [Lewinellaceae bacterium]